jgi:hypothetical protein
MQRDVSTVEQQSLKKDWFVTAKFWLMEIASFLGFGMWLVWALWKEFCHLFLSK